MNRVLVLVFLLLSLFSSVARAGDPMVCEGTPREKAWDRECAQESAAAEKKMPALLRGKAKCAQVIPQFKNQNTRCQWYPVQERHIAGLIAEAFRSWSIENRSAALNYLEYFCEHTDHCRPYRERLDSEVKSHILAWRKSLPELAERAEKLRARLEAKAKQD